MTRSTSFNPNGLLDALIEMKSLKNDAALSRALEVAPPVISKIRHHTLPVGPTLILRIHEAFEMPVKAIQAYLQPLAA